jgi:hypothetical protein
MFTVLIMHPSSRLSILSGKSNAMQWHTLCLCCFPFTFCLDAKSNKKIKDNPIAPPVCPAMPPLVKHTVISLRKPKV